MLEIPDGHRRLELTTFHAPSGLHREIVTPAPEPDRRLIREGSRFGSRVTPQRAAAGRSPAA